MKRMFTVHYQSQVKSSRVKSAEHTLQREIYVATSHFSFSSDFGCWLVHPMPDSKQRFILKHAIRLIVWILLFFFFKLNQ